MKTAEKARRRNKRVKSIMRRAIKSYLKENEKSPENLKTIAKIVDKAAAKRVIHKNKAARIKSRLAKMAVKS